MYRIIVPLLLVTVSLASLVTYRNGGHDIDCEKVGVSCLTSPVFCDVTNNECQRVVGVSDGEVAYLVRGSKGGDVAALPYRTNDDGSQDYLLCFPEQGQRYLVNSKKDEPIVFTSNSISGGVYILRDGFICVFSADETPGLATATTTTLNQLSVFPLQTNATIVNLTTVYPRRAPKESSNESNEDESSEEDGDGRSLKISGKLTNELIYNREDSQNVQSAINRMNSVVEEEDRPKKKKNFKKIVEDYEEDEDEVTTKKPRRRTTTEKPTRRTTKKYVEDYDEEEEDVEETTTTKKPKSKKRVEEEEEEEEEEKPKKQTRKTKTPKKINDEEETQVTRSPKRRNKFNRNAGQENDYYYDDNSAIINNYILLIGTFAFLYMSW